MLISKIIEIPENLRKNEIMAQFHFFTAHEQIFFFSDGVSDFFAHLANFFFALSQNSAECAIKETKLSHFVLIDQQHEITVVRKVLL